VLTDPPYGNAAHYGRDRKKILNDETPLVGLLALPECYRVLRRNRCCFFFLGIQHLPFVRSFVEQYTSFTIRDVIVWDKCQIGFGHGFRKRHELILALEKGRPKYYDHGLANVLCVNRVHCPDHPHEKPVELLRLLIDHATLPGDLVIDPFMGSGSTGVVAAFLDRRFCGFELDKGYFQAANSNINNQNAV